MHGRQFIADTLSANGTETFVAFNPANGQPLEPRFHEATREEIDRALQAADAAFETYRGLSPEDIARFLEAIADAILDLGDDLLERAHQETGLPMGRLTGERGRTVNQARRFAQVVREGSWVDARIDQANPDRTPIPKPDVRRMLIPLGPVVVFGASNFPLAFSVAGGDTVSALAAGCPVVVKAHPAHPGTCEWVATAIRNAVTVCDLPEGVFSMVHGAGHAVGTTLTEHPLTTAVAFTGSLRGGRALFDAAARRAVPIPVFAEMGSVNPVFVLPEALAERGEAIAAGYVGSVNLGVGQFCTNPGLLVGMDSPALNAFMTAAAERVRDTAPATMLHDGIRQAYNAGVERVRGVTGVANAATSVAEPDAGQTQAASVLFKTDAETFLAEDQLSEEVFGPASIVIVADTVDDLERIARTLDGHLTATVHATETDLVNHEGLLRILERKVGRIVHNGFPTGVEVCASMHHGGPYPATTDSRFTSVGTAAILRFARPICYQNIPDTALPPALRNANPLGLWRLVDNQLTRDAL